MTLILTVANEGGIWQTSDYRLTDPRDGSFFTDTAGTKQIFFSHPNLSIQVSFTGVAALSNGKHTRDWIIATLKGVDAKAADQEVFNHLRDRCNSELGRVRPASKLTIVLAVAAVSRPFKVVTISNINWCTSPPSYDSTFSIHVETITDPYFYFDGCRDLVTTHQENRLRALSRMDNSAAIIRGLQDINSEVAAVSNGAVSADCWVTTQAADGDARHFAGSNAGNSTGVVNQVTPGLDLEELIRRTFVPGFLGRLRQMVGVMGAGKPMPPPTGEPRRFGLSISKFDFDLSHKEVRSARARFVGIEGEVACRLNEEIVIQLGNLEFDVLRAASSEGAQPPLLPWPTARCAYAIDAVEVPGGAQISIGYWPNAGEHHLVIFPASRALRELPFLGDNEELVIVFPGAEIKIDANLSTLLPLTARMQWRQRIG
jgi:hypothetical protein